MRTLSTRSIAGNTGELNSTLCGEAPFLRGSGLAKPLISCNSSSSVSSSVSSSANSSIGSSANSCSQQQCAVLVKPARDACIGSSNVSKHNYKCQCGKPAKAATALTLEGLRLLRSTSMHAAVRSDLSNLCSEKQTDD
jgi:hypothetical protein